MINRLIYKSIAFQCANVALTSALNGAVVRENECLEVNERLQERLLEAEEEVCVLTDLHEKHVESFDSMKRELSSTLDTLRKVQHGKAAQDKHVCLLVKEKDRMYDEIKRLNTKSSQCLRCKEGSASLKSRQMAYFSSPRAGANTGGDVNTPPTAQGRVGGKEGQSPPLTGMDYAQGGSDVLNQSTNSVESNCTDIKTPTKSMLFSPTQLTSSEKKNISTTIVNSNMSNTWKVNALQKALDAAKGEIAAKNKEINDLKLSKQDLVNRYRNSKAEGFHHRRSVKEGTNSAEDIILADLSKQYKFYTENIARRL